MQYGHGEQLKAFFGDKKWIVVFAEEQLSHPLFYTEALFSFLRALFNDIAAWRCQEFWRQARFQTQTLSAAIWTGFGSIAWREKNGNSLGERSFIIKKCFIPVLSLFGDTGNPAKVSQLVLSAGHVCCPSAEKNRWPLTIASCLRRKFSEFQQSRQGWHQHHLLSHVISFILFVPKTASPPQRSLFTPSPAIPQ